MSDEWEKSQEIRINGLRLQLAERDATIAELQAQLAERDALIAQFRADIANRDEELARLNSVFSVMKYGVAQ